MGERTPVWGGIFFRVTVMEVLLYQQESNRAFMPVLLNTMCSSKLNLRCEMLL
jgi:hypothetical protein